MSGRTIGAKPRPRALIVGFDDQTADRISKLFPTVRKFEKLEDLEHTHLDEWDLVVLNSDGFGNLPQHIYVVGFGANGVGRAEVERSQYSVDFVVSHDAESLAQEFQVPGGLHPDLKSLVERDLLPLVRGRNRNAVVTETATYSSRPASPDADWLTPFLVTTEPTVLAGSVLRAGGEAEAWSLPQGLSDPVPWVRVAMRVWHGRDASRFPFDPGWPSDTRWMTARETALLDALDELEQKRETYLEDSLRREEELRKEHAAAADDAERGLRGLLTSQGDDLVAAVQVTLEDLGFSAQNRDEVNPLSDRLEDLWVTSPVDDPDWIAIAEVKGYAGGAQVSALLSITGRFVPRFFESRGRYPSRKWYIVNQFIGQDPGTRPPALSTNPNELAEFESQQGLVIDTSVLFSLARDVETGRVSAEAARRMLIESVGRFELEPGD